MPPKQRKYKVIQKEFQATDQKLVEAFKRLEAVEFPDAKELAKAEKLRKQWKDLLAEAKYKVAHWDEPADPAFASYIKTQDTKTAPLLSKRSLDLQNKAELGTKERENIKKFGPLPARQAKYRAAKKEVADLVAAARKEMTEQTVAAEASLKAANHSIKLAEQAAGNPGGGSDSIIAAFENALKELRSVVASAKDQEAKYNTVLKATVPHRENKGVGSPATYGLDGSQVDKETLGYVNSILIDFAELSRLQSRLESVRKATDVIQKRAAQVRQGYGSNETLTKMGLEAAQQVADIAHFLSVEQGRGTVPSTNEAERCLAALKSSNEDTEALMKADRIMQQQKLLDDAVPSFVAQQKTAKKVFDRLAKLPAPLLNSSRMKAALTKATTDMKTIDDVVKEVVARKARMDDICRQINFWRGQN